MLLALLQVVVSWTSARLPGGRAWVTSSPVVLVHDGVVDEDAARRQRVTAAEIRQAVRSTGVGGLDLVALVVLESDGTLSVITHDQRGDGTALEQP